MDSEAQASNFTPWIDVQSSNLKRFRYNHDTEQMDIMFNAKANCFYRYFGVTETVFNLMRQASDLDRGWYFRRVFVNSYPYKIIEIEDEGQVS